MPSKWPGQIECEKILPPHLATAVSARDFDKARRAVEADRNVPELGESLQIAPGPATEIGESEGTLAANVIQHRRDVLHNVMPTRALPESLRALIVMMQRGAADLFQLIRAWIHSYASEQWSRHPRHRKHQART